MMPQVVVAGTQDTLFPAQKCTQIFDMNRPKTYTGLAGFHKYWGKKPVESLSYLIENCTQETDIIMDPFLGSGLIALECLNRKRRFIGIDINPFSIEHSTFLLNLPTLIEYRQAFHEIERSVVKEIYDSYMTENGRIASHYLWEGDQIQSVWVAGIGRTRTELPPTQFDSDCHLRYETYNSRYFRELKLYVNSRINVSSGMTIRNIFTGRAMRNIDILIDSFTKYPAHLKRSLMMTLTSAIGQMSKMVFVIKNRQKGEKKNENSRVEVGSWVIGFWTPHSHFEINVWNCFRNRARKLLKVLPEYHTTNSTICNDLSDLERKNCSAWLINRDCRQALQNVPKESVTLVCTDPPHSDRVPYLELSEIWNSLLGYDVDFEKEIVVSNAKGRQKNKIAYGNDMADFFGAVSRVLKTNGYMALYFNARDKESWNYIHSMERVSDTLKFIGSFPMTYSATSVVQDTRTGALKHDFIIMYQKRVNGQEYQVPKIFSEIPNWSNSFPKKDLE